MVSRRQRVARKSFKQAHPELFQEPISQRPKEARVEKVRPVRKKTKSISTNNPLKKSFRKHPFRFPGMKPGESCFICKAKYHVAKACPKKDEWERKKTCLRCRQRGHSLKRCPKQNDMSAERFCYNCGDKGHSLAKCPHPLQDGGTRYALCFICSQQGHLSKDCPQNSHGVYPKGGCCKTCGDITHLSRNCPNRDNKRSSAPEGICEKETKFLSGDDLQDDFLTLERNSSGNKQKKSGPKVIRFAQ